MILTCPRCATRYLVEPEQLWTTGRTVQCDACGQRWRASGTGTAPTPPSDPPPPEAPAEAEIETHADSHAEPPVEAPPEPRSTAEPVTERVVDAVRPTDSPREPDIAPHPVRDPPSAEPEFEPFPGFTPLEPPPALAPAAAVEQPALFRQTPKRSPQVGNGPPGLGRAVAILFLLAIFVGVLVLFQDAIVRAVPALAPIYSGLGLSNLSLTGVGAHG